MIWPFKKEVKNVLGVDIGTSQIRVIELSKQGWQIKLENYGFCSLAPFSVKYASKEQTPILSSKEISIIISRILREANFHTKNSFFAVPDYSTFFTTFELPPMSKEEVESAVRFEAARHVPLPLAEVTLDWNYIEGRIDDPKKGPLKILLVAVPNDIIKQYQRIAQDCNLSILALEAEAFALVRSLINNQNVASIIIDIGAQSTTCNVVDKKILKISHSFDIAGNEFTKRVSTVLNISWEEAEELKKRQGLIPGEPDTRTVLSPLADLILNEIEKVAHSFYQAEGKEVEHYVLAGGSALLPGLKEYFTDFLKKEVEIVNPFANLIYPPILQDIIQELAPSFSIVLGMAMKGLK